MSGQQLTGTVTGAQFSDGKPREIDCGLDLCDCPEHEWDAEHPTPAGTYITVRLDEDAPVGFGRVTVTYEPRPEVLS